MVDTAETTLRDERRILTPLVATLVMLVALLLWWSPGGESQLTDEVAASETQEQAGSSSKRDPHGSPVRTRHDAGARVGSPRPLGDLRLIAKHWGDGTPVQGLEVLLLPALSSGDWTVDAQQASVRNAIRGVGAELAAVFSNRVWKDYEWQRLTSAAGVVEFVDVPLGKYQLLVLSPGVFEFDARPSPFRRSVKTNPGERNIEVDRRFDPRRLITTQLSGHIPLTAEAITETHVYQHSGCTVRARLPLGEHPRSYFLLSRTQDQVEAPIEQVSNSETVEFNRLRAGYGYKLWGWYRSHQLYHCFVHEFSLQDGQILDLGVVQGIDPHIRHRIRSEIVDSDGGVLRAKDVLLGAGNLRLTVRRRKPTLSPRFIVPFESEFWIVGMRDIKITDVVLHESSPVAGWRIDGFSGDVSRLPAGEITLRLKVRRNTRMSEVSVTIVPPKGFEYTSDVTVKFRTPAGDEILQVTFDRGKLSAPCELPVGAKLRVRIFSFLDGSDPEAISRTAREFPVEISGEELIIKDPGPANGLGVKKR